jgi:hypothetical protein
MKSSRFKLTEWKITCKSGKLFKQKVSFHKTTYDGLFKNCVIGMIDDMPSFDPDALEEFLTEEKTVLLPFKK